MRIAHSPFYGGSMGAEEVKGTSPQVQSLPPAETAGAETSLFEDSPQDPRGRPTLDLGIIQETAKNVVHALTGQKPFEINLSTMPAITPLPRGNEGGGQEVVASVRRQTGDGKQTSHCLKVEQGQVRVLKGSQVITVSAGTKLVLEAGDIVEHMDGGQPVVITDSRLAARSAGAQTSHFSDKPEIKTTFVEFEKFRARVGRIATTLFDKREGYIRKMMWNAEYNRLEAMGLSAEEASRQTSEKIVKGIYDGTIFDVTPERTAAEARLPSVQEGAQSRLPTMVDTSLDVPNGPQQAPRLDPKTIDHHGRHELIDAQGLPVDKNASMMVLDKFQRALTEAGGDVDLALKKLDIRRVTTDNLGDGAFGTWLMKNARRVLMAMKSGGEIGPGLSIDDLRVATDFEDFKLFRVQCNDLAYQKTPGAQLGAALVEAHNQIISHNPEAFNPGGDRFNPKCDGVTKARIMAEAHEAIETVISDSQVRKSMAAGFFEARTKGIAAAQEGIVPELTDADQVVVDVNKMRAAYGGKMPVFIEFAAPAGAAAEGGHRTQLTFLEQPLIDGQPIRRTMIGAIPNIPEVNGKNMSATLEALNALEKQRATELGVDVRPWGARANVAFNFAGSVLTPEEVSTVIRAKLDLSIPEALRAKTTEVKPGSPAPSEGRLPSTVDLGRVTTATPILGPNGEVLGGILAGDDGFMLVGQEGQSLQLKTDRGVITLDGKQASMAKVSSGDTIILKDGRKISLINSWELAPGGVADSRRPSLLKGGWNVATAFSAMYGMDLAEHFDVGTVYQRLGASLGMFGGFLAVAPVEMGLMYPGMAPGKEGFQSLASAIGRTTGIADLQEGGLSHKLIGTTGGILGGIASKQALDAAWEFLRQRGTVGVSLDQAIRSTPLVQYVTTLGAAGASLMSSAWAYVAPVIEGVGGVFEGIGTTIVGAAVALKGAALAVGGAAAAVVLADTNIGTWVGDKIYEAVHPKAPKHEKEDGRGEWFGDKIYEWAHPEAHQRHHEDGIAEAIGDKVYAGAQKVKEWFGKEEELPRVTKRSEIKMVKAS